MPPFVDYNAYFSDFIPGTNIYIYQKTSTVLPTDVVPLFTSGGVEYDERETLMIDGRFTKIDPTDQLIPDTASIVIPVFKIKGIENCGSPSISIKY